jgi:transcriptional regulator with XRE-family HTH domain
VIGVLRYPFEAGNAIKEVTGVHTANLGRGDPGSPAGLPRTTWPEARRAAQEDSGTPQSDEADWRRREELRSLLTARRSRLGRHQPGRRGLRQEDAAILSGLSTRSYAALERGAARNPSLDLVESVARGLEMTPAERSALHVLAAGQDPPMPATPPGGGQREVGPGLRELIALLDIPAAITDEMWTMLIRNHALTAWTGGWFDSVPRREQNLVLFLFSPEAEHMLPDVHAHRRAILAALRYQYARHIGSDRFAELIGTILDTSPEARQFWQRHEIDLPRRQSTTRVRYPGRGVIEARTLMAPLSPRTWLMLTWLPEGLQPPGRSQAQAPCREAGPRS